MKNKFKKIFFIITLIGIINIPLIVLLERKNTSYEQPAFKFKPENLIDMAREENSSIEKNITAKRNNLSGISLIIFNNKFFNTASLKLQIFEGKEDSTQLVREEGYRLNLDYLYKIVNLTFSPIEKSKSKKYIIKLTAMDNPEQYFLAYQTNKKQPILRLLYYNENISSDLRDRISQYKPLFLKDPIPSFVYLLFNLLLFVFFYKTIRK